MVEGHGITQGPMRALSPSLSSNDIDDDHVGNYSSRMGELFDDDDREADDVDENFVYDGMDADSTGTDDAEEGFVYDGVDAEQVTSTHYHEQLRDVLGPEDSSDIFEEDEVERSLLREDFSDKFDAPHVAPDADTALFNVNEVQVSSTEPSNIRSDELRPPFLHPAVSRLRSSIARELAMQHGDRGHLADSSATMEFTSPLIHGSDVSRTSTSTTSKGLNNAEREVFRWTALRNAGNRLYGQRPSKAAVMLGATSLGSPVALAANGLICIGTDRGRIFVFDFKQTLQCICGSDSSGSTVGPVSAVTLSHDHTYVASGHVSGYIQLFELKNPKVPARLVIPASAQAVLSGRQEGHLTGARIVNVSFVAGRHTAIVSADENGLSFYHSLGKVLFVEATDTIRILGSYPEEQVIAPDASHMSYSSPNGSSPRPFRRRRPRNTILAMATLPLGTAAHPTDSYHIVALLTPTKLVMVGMKPMPKTWLKRARDDAAESTSMDRNRGTLSWFPSVREGQGLRAPAAKSTHPTLAYSWGKAIQLVRVSETTVKQTVTNVRTGKARNMEIGTLVFEELGKWRMEEAVLALEWLNLNQLAVFTATNLSVYDFRTLQVIERVNFDASTLVSRTLGPATNGSVDQPEFLGDVAHSVHTYKGKIFILGREELRVGTLLTWADKILSLVERGDFLRAIELTRSYYTEEVPGNRNGLPEDREERSRVLGKKLQELMAASARYAFSEDRMTDGTHSSPDGRGVDRTSVFEGLVTTCTRACISLASCEFLFEDLFQYFEDAGITRIYLEQVEAFILDGTIRFVPPRITQRLVALHDDNRQPDMAERIIWHIDSSCLDINQAIRLCQTHQLWDALIYVYTRALQDYVSPVVQLLDLIRQPLAGGTYVASGPRFLVTPLKHAYKIFPYLINTLSGLAYPSGEPLPPDESLRAKKDVYQFIFNGTSTIWPAQGGSLVLTGGGNGVEPSYPYARLLLRFDAEAFLHSMDIAFEDSFLNDEYQSISRLWVVNILRDIACTNDLKPSDVTFIDIFIARNIPKYPQFLAAPLLNSPGVFRNILVSLCTSSDPATHEDRQLAVEYLLSVYTPHQDAQVLSLLEGARFYRVLQHWHRQERRWTHLLSSYLQDPSLNSVDVFSCVDDVLSLSRADNHGIIPDDILNTLSTALGHLLQADSQLTAVLIDKFVPNLHAEVLSTMDPADDRGRYDYLLHLLGSRSQDDVFASDRSLGFPRVSGPLRQLFVQLQCRYMPSSVIDTIKRVRSLDLDWPTLEQICEDNQAYGAVLWAMNQRGLPREALAKAEAFEKQLTRDVVRGLTGSDPQGEEITRNVSALQEVGKRGASICVERSFTSLTDLPPEDIWFQVLSSQLHSVQVVSNTRVPGGDAIQHLKRNVLSTLRCLVQETFAYLVAVSSTRALSFPRLFKRLVDPGLYAGSGSGTPYAEFRTILIGMLDSYRTDEDMLLISQRLLNQDVFDAVEEYTRERHRGWSAQQGACLGCRQPLLQADGSTMDSRVVISRAAIYHSRCLPS
ncbi:Golgi CORVET complex core vacuolar protein 8-domain-containing protein [Phlebopus sp. FC_14]|nr:Golgi CORVET complex core vacuolar protein 8-domain-containing protein [Phlebopus sp. FC_14]